MWKNNVEPAKAQILIWRMRTARWIPEATNIHSQHLIRTVFPLQRWLHDRTSLLRYTHIVCLVKFLHPEMRYKDTNSTVFRQQQAACMKPCAN
jgi:hypothetical protein